MSTLHIVRQSAFMTNDLAQCLSIISGQDALVLIDDGCYNLEHSLLQPLLKTSITQPNNAISINVIKHHAQARALKAIETVSLIEMAELVALTFTHQRVITWQ